MKPKIPNPTYIYRIIHINNLEILLKRKGLHAPNHEPDDKLEYKKIHNEDIQSTRKIREIPCGPGGAMHDYVPFYFGPLSPMLYQLKTGWVRGYDEGQEPIIYLVSSVQAVIEANTRFVFSDGHGIAAFSSWYDDLAQLCEVDWNMVGQRYWSENSLDNDRMRRKQAEFLVYRFLPWKTLLGIAVLNDKIKSEVEGVLDRFPKEFRKNVKVIRAWYYH